MTAWANAAPPIRSKAMQVVSAISALRLPEKIDFIKLLNFG
jgi:hypothetical protein